MGKERYRAKVISIGEYAKDFIECGIVVLFGKSAPDELKEHAIIHENNGLSEDVRKGDTVWIDDKPFPILAVGKVANTNLGNLGHLVLKFNGLNEPEMDGDVNVPEVPIPEIAVGTLFKIVE